ncbi:MAG: ribonuclease HI family protein [Roseiflexus sp.]
MKRLLVQVDGTSSQPPRGIVGLGIVVRDMAGAVLAWSCERAPAHTNNEAEYLAVIAGLNFVLRRYPDSIVCCMTDSQIVVEQLAGRSAVRAATLQPLHVRARALAHRHGRVTFVAIPRELNRLADALAWEALDGRGWLARVGNEHHRF